MVILFKQRVKELVYKYCKSFEPKMQKIKETEMVFFFEFVYASAKMVREKFQKRVYTIYA